MNIDLTKLITSIVDEIEIDNEVVIPEEYFKGTSVRKLENVTFSGVITKLYSGDYQISGKLSGKMVLPDDITLEDVSVKFTSEIEENFTEFGSIDAKDIKIVQNRLDITEFLWQNILVEIPLKVRSSKNDDLTLEGDGWRLITEEELETSNNSPFSELSKMFDSRKE